MSKIIKTEAVVLSKLNYGDSSSIVTLFTKEYGKLSAMLKGGRNPKSKISLIVDPINYLEVIFYNNPSRDLQILSSADFKAHFRRARFRYRCDRGGFAGPAFASGTGPDAARPGQCDSDCTRAAARGRLPATRSRIVRDWAAGRRADSSYDRSGRVR